jgi:hypothetical protein
MIAAAQSIPLSNLCPSLASAGPGLVPSFLSGATLLPPGWKARRTEAGQMYFVDNTTRTTSWEHPILLGESTRVWLAPLHRSTISADMRDAAAALEARTGHAYVLQTGGPTPAHAPGAEPVGAPASVDVGPIFRATDVWPVDQLALPPGWEFVASPRGYAIFIRHHPGQLVTHVDPRAESGENYPVPCQ